MTPENEINVVVYQIYSEHWAHAEQVRWTLLSNFLVAMSIVLLGWVAVVSASLPAEVSKKLILLLLSFAGIFLSIVWLALSMRCNSFVEMYAKAAKGVEDKITGKEENQTEEPKGAFQAAEKHRNDMIKRFFLPRVARSSYVANFIPIVFLVIYVVLVGVSFTVS